MKLSRILLSVISAYIALISLMYFVLFYKATFSHYRSPPQILLIEMFLLLLAAAFMFSFLITYNSKLLNENYAFLSFIIGSCLIALNAFVYPKAIQKVSLRYLSQFNDLSEFVQSMTPIVISAIVAIVLAESLVIKIKDWRKRKSMEINKLLLK